MGGMGVGFLGVGVGGGGGVKSFPCQTHFCYVGLS